MLHTRADAFSARKTREIRGQMRRAFFRFLRTAWVSSSSNAIKRLRYLKTSTLSNSSPYTYNFEFMAKMESETAFRCSLAACMAFHDFAPWSLLLPGSPASRTDCTWGSIPTSACQIDPADA